MYLDKLSGCGVTVGYVVNVLQVIETINMECMAVTVQSHARESTRGVPMYPPFVSPSAFSLSYIPWPPFFETGPCEVSQVDSNL